MLKAWHNEKEWQSECVCEKLKKGNGYNEVSKKIKKVMSRSRDLKNKRKEVPEWYPRECESQKGRQYQRTEMYNSK